MCRNKKIKKVFFYLTSWIFRCITKRLSQCIYRTVAWYLKPVTFEQKKKNWKYFTSQSWMSLFFWSLTQHSKWAHYYNCSHCTFVEQNRAIEHWKHQKNCNNPLASYQNMSMVMGNCILCLCMRPKPTQDHRYFSPNSSYKVKCK